MIEPPTVDPEADIDAGVADIRGAAGAAGNRNAAELARIVAADRDRVGNLLLLRSAGAESGAVLRSIRCVGEGELESAERRCEVDDLRRVVLEVCRGRVARYDLTGAEVASSVS